MKRLLSIAILLPALFVPMRAQEPTDRPSIHRIESEAHGGDRIDTTAAGGAAAESPAGAQTVRPGKRVFGYYPYWSGTSDHLAYDYAALTTIGYFSLEVDTADGRYLSFHNWGTAPVKAYARERGIKVVLVVTNFGYEANDKILGNPAKRATLVATLVDIVATGGGDGVNIDFEQVNGTQRENLVLFMRDLASAMRQRIPGAEISMAIPAVDWSSAFDAAQLAVICDYLIVMGYDYYWSGSSTAGPVAPLEGESYNVTRSVTTYLGLGVPPAKLLLGVPWYGYDWPVADTSRKATTTGRARSLTYKVAEPAALAAGKIFDVQTKVPWYRYTQDGTPRQIWYDDSLSLALKYALVNGRSMGGIGIWALGYEGGRSEIWNGILQAFGAEPSSVAWKDEDLDATEMTVAGSVIRVAAPRSRSVALEIFDAMGRSVATAADMLSIDLAALPLPNGVYFARLRVGDRALVRRVLVAR